MRELNTPETTYIGGGIKNIEVAVYSGIVGSVVGLAAGKGYFTMGTYGLMAMGTGGFLVGTTIGTAFVCSAALIKFAFSDTSLS